jgi:outer membrane receptor for ferrienterochelin and colicins
MKRLIYLIVFTLLVGEMMAQEYSITGKVTSEGENLPFVNVMLKGTTLGVATDASGFYQMSGVPGGKHVVQVQAVGYKTKRIPVEIDEQPENLDIDLEPDVLQLDQVVVSADRNEINRSKAPVIVNTVGPEQLNAVQSATVSDGLNYLPGLRTENNCQNCGFTQLRMNGMEGAYSQVLINGRSIFSGLAGVYGLEILPAGMIERLEVIRGGGSALYGSNAIAGTVNVITKDPVRNAYAFKYNQNITGIGIKGANPANDYMINFNSSIVRDNARNGLSLYGFYRLREPFDANGDSFSELAKIENLTMGGRFYQRLNLKSKITADVYAINAKRRGGNKFDVPLHESDIAEAVDHTITSAALTYERFVKDDDEFSAYLSAQNINRDSYYGAEQALDTYGNTKNLTYVGGVQYNARMERLRMTAGIENQGDMLRDTKLAHRYFDSDAESWVHVPNTTVANQMLNTTGTFVQTDYTWGNLKTALGLRYDHYLIVDNQNESENVSGDVLSPRVNLMYDFSDHLQTRMSYSQGFRAPQIFDEDLHIETSGARRVIHRNADDLKQETSHSAMTSISYHPEFGESHVEFLAEGFYTRLIDPFTNQYGTPDQDGNVVYTRVNADGYAHVYGLNFELNWIYNETLSLSSGFTLQKSEFSSPQEYGETRFFRSPDDYGYLTAQIIPANRWKLTLTENYTGKMLVPYFGPHTENPDEGELRVSERFFDTGLKVCYELPLNRFNLNVFAGMKNIFNSYQDDFDRGLMRDPAYVYGPMQPRTLYFGVKIGDFK